jgi:hypothetical protein
MSQRCIFTHSRWDCECIINNQTTAHIACNRTFKTFTRSSHTNQIQSSLLSICRVAIRSVHVQREIVHSGLNETRQRYPRFFESCYNPNRTWICFAVSCSGRCMAQSFRLRHLCSYLLVVACGVNWLWRRVCYYTYTCLEEKNDQSRKRLINKNAGKYNNLPKGA